MRRFALFVAVVGAAFAASIQTAGATPRITATPKLSVSGKPAAAGSATTLRLGVALAHGDRVAEYSLKYGDVSHLVTGKKVPGTLRHVFGRPGKYTATLTITDTHHRTTHTSVRFTVSPKKNAVVTPPVPVPRAPLVLPDGYQQTGSLPAGAVQAADLDGNGTTDVVITNASYVSVFGWTEVVSTPVIVELGDGHGNFTQVADSGIDATAARIEDMNGDGIPDLVEVGSWESVPDFDEPSSSFGIALGDGHGGFRGAGSMLAAGIGAGSVLPGVLDLGDPGPDLVVGDQAYPTDGHGGLLAGRQLSGVQPSGVTVGREASDMVAVDGSSLDVYTKDGSGSAALTTVALPGVSGPSVIDLGNGRVAVGTRTATGQAVTTVDLTGVPTVLSTVPLPSDFTGDLAQGPRLDLNGDGRTDFVSTAGSIAFGTASGYVSGGRMSENVALATSQFLLLDGPSGYDVVARS